MLVSNPFWWKGGTCGHHISCPRENIERRCEDKCLPIVLKSLFQLIQCFRANIGVWEFSLCDGNCLKSLLGSSAECAFPVLSTIMAWSSWYQCPFHEPAHVFQVGTGAFSSPPLSHGGSSLLPPEQLHHHLGLHYFYRGPIAYFSNGFPTLCT